MTKDGVQGCFFAPLTVVAGGYNSKFRREDCSTKPVSKSKFWALELQDVTLPSPFFGHVILGDFSPVLLYQIGKHETRVLVDVPDKPSKGWVEQRRRDGLYEKGYPSSSS